MPETAAAPPAPHVAVLAFPTFSHAFPLATVVRRLASAAPHVRFSFLSTAGFNASLFPDGRRGEVGNIRAYNVSDGLPEGHAFRGSPVEAMDLFIAAAPAAFRLGMEAAEAETGRKVSLVVSDAFMWFVAEMAVPWVAFWPAGLATLLAHIYTDTIREKIGMDGREDETLEFIPGLMSWARVRELPEGIVFGNFTMLHKMGQTLPSSEAMLVNSFEELDPPVTNHLKSKFKKFLCVGPINAQQAVGSPPVHDPNGCIPWLERQTPSSVAYVSFGSVMIPPPTELVAVAQALEASGVPFLWSLKDNAKAHLPEGFPKNGMVVPWAPQNEVLAHRAVGVFVCHGGWNSVLESIAGCVPMICRPLLADNRMNARVAEIAWGVGVDVGTEGFTKEGLARDLELVLSSEEGKKMRARIKELNAVAEKAVGPGGSSTANFSTLLDTVVGRASGF